MADTLESLLTEGRRRLAEAPFEPSTREASLLLGRVLDLTESQLLARSDEGVSADQATRFSELLERRLTGEPIAYIFEEKEFYGRSFRVDPRVLIPRPETEHLVEAALELGLPPKPKILDLGTGCGCLAVTLALELPDSGVVATDLSPAALAVAAANVRTHSVQDRVHPIACDLATPLDLAPFDLVVSNPPYIDPAERPNLSIEVTHFEPTQALFAADQGTAVLERLLTHLAGLRPDTPVLLEIGHDQADTITDQAAKHSFTLQAIHPDLAGHPRVASLLSP